VQGIVDCLALGDSDARKVGKRIVVTSLMFICANDIT
jgi:hypothetical protein